MDYLILDCCNDTLKLKSIRSRLRRQASGMNVTIDKVSGRKRLLEHYGDGVADDEG